MGGVVPGPGDRVLIPTGVEVVVRGPYTVATPAACWSVDVQGTLTIGTPLSAGARGLQVDSAMVISGGGLLRNDGADIHSLLIGGDLVVDGQVNFKNSTGYARMVFNGIDIQSISGSAEALTLPVVSIEKVLGDLNATGSMKLIFEELNVNSGIFFGPDHLEVASLLKVKDGEFVAGDTTIVHGNLIVENGGFTSSNGTLVFDGQNQTVSSIAQVDFGTVIVSGQSVLNLTGKSKLFGDLLIQDGTTLNCGNAMEVTGTTIIGEGISGLLKIVQTQGTKTFAGPLVVKPGGTFDNSLGDNGHFQSGIDNQGNFIDGAGTNYFETNSQSVAGALTLNQIFIEPGITVTNNGQVVSQVAFGGPGNWVQGRDARITLKGTITANLVSADSVGNTVDYAGNDQKVVSLVYHNLHLSGTGTMTFQTGFEKVNGDLVLSGTNQASTKQALQVGGKLVIGDANQFSVTNAITVHGPTNVGTGNGGALYMTATAGTKTFSGKLTIAPKATFSNTANDNVHYQSGLEALGTFIGGTAVHYFEANSQDIKGEINILTAFLNLGIEVTNNGTVTIANSLTGSGTFKQGPLGVLNLGGAYDVRKLDFTEPGNTVNFTGGNQTIPVGSFFNLGLSGSAAAAVKTLQAGTSTIRGNLTISGNAALTTIEPMTIAGNLVHTGVKSFINAHTVSITGDISGTGTIEQAAAAILYINGDATGVVIRGGNTSNTVNYLRANPGVLGGDYSVLNIEMNGGEAVLKGDVTVSSRIALGAGSLILGPSNLTLAATSVLDIPNPSATSMIITDGTGELRRAVSAVGTYSFPIGDNDGIADYNPVTIEITSATAFSQAYLGVSVANRKAEKNFSPSNFLSRFWKITQSGITGCVVTFNSSYFQDDVTGQESGIKLSSYSGTYNAVTNAWKTLGSLSGGTISQSAVSLPAQVSTVITGVGVSTPSVTITGGNGAAICAGSSATLTGNYTGDGAASYVWTPASGLTAPGAMQTDARPASTTVYTLTVYDPNGASATATTTVTVQQPVVAASDAEFCSGGSVNLTASGALDYAWSPSTGLSAVTGATVSASPSQSTEYQVIGKDAQGCADTVRVKVTVNPYPGKPGITAQNLLTDRPVLTSSGSTGNQWFRDGVAIQGATASTYTASESGNYTVRVTLKNCTGPASDNYVLVVTGLDDGLASGRVYPNPSDAEVTFDLAGFDRNKPLMLELRDSQGRMISSRLVDAEHAVVDLSTVPAGIYFMTAGQGVKKVTRKVMRRAGQ